MPRLSHIGLFGAAATSFMLAACAPTTQTASTDDTGFIPGGDYVLVGIDGGALPLRNVTVRVSEKSITGHGPCNGYAAKNNAELPAVALDPLNKTSNPCKNAALENHFFNTLQSASSMEFYGGVLKVKAPQTWLIFERGVPKDDAVNALEAARGTQQP